METKETTMWQLGSRFESDVSFAFSWCYTRKVPI